MDALLAAGEHDEVGRRALQIIAQTNLVFPREAIALKNGLKDENNQRLFAESLRALLYGDAEAGSRFAAFCDRLAEMGAAKWPLATYLPFVAFPEREMFLKPTVTRKVAEMLGFELSYSVEPNWLTYSKLLELSRHLFVSLAELRPRDMIDIQSFISRVASYEEDEQHPEGEPPERAATKPRAARAAADAQAAGAPAGDAEGAGEPPWATGVSDSRAGAAETPGAVARPESSAAARPEDAEGAAAQPAAGEASGAVAQSAAGEATGVDEESGAGEAPNAGEVSSSNEVSGAGGEPGVVAEPGVAEGSGAGEAAGAPGAGTEEAAGAD
jgi:hypothetical protein